MRVEGPPPPPPSDRHTAFHVHGIAHELLYAVTLVAIGMLLARYGGWMHLVCVEGVSFPLR